MKSHITGSSLNPFSTKFKLVAADFYENVITYTMRERDREREKVREQKAHSILHFALETKLKANWYTVWMSFEVV